MPNKAAKQLEKIKSDKKLLVALIFAMVAIFTWVAIGLLTASKKQLASSDLTKLAEPLVPTLDQKLLERLENKNYLDQEQLKTFPIMVLVELDSGEHTLIDVANQSVQEFSTQQEGEEVEVDGRDNLESEMNLQNQQELEIELENQTPEGSIETSGENEENQNSVFDQEAAEEESLNIVD